MPFVSAGAYVRELDFSDYVPALSSSILGILTTATKGPVNDPTLITNEGDLVREFGFPQTDDYGLQSGIHFLRRGKQLIVNRIGTAAIAKASVTVLDAGAAAVFTIEALTE